MSLKQWMTPKGMLLLFLFTVGGLVVIGLGTYELLQATESSRFCGEVCHTPMHPEYTAYQVSPHSEIECSSCHVGAGSYNLVSSKARGIPQIFETITGNYPRPIPTPIKTLAPVLETCEKCHTPRRFTGFVLQTSAFYQTDEANTRQTDTIVLNVGGGSTGTASGIHWHITQKVYYLPLDDKRLQIGWVGVEENGKLTEYIDPAAVGSITPQRIDAEKRLMDCVDCHNRATHIFRTPDDLINQAMEEGSISTGIPFIKREALNAIGSPRPSLEDAYARAESVRQFYRNNYSRFYTDNLTLIDQAVNELKDISKLTTFPEMRVDWNTYPDNKGHNKPPDSLLAGLNITFTNWKTNQTEGCFRCHWKLAPATRTATGFNISGTPVKLLDASCNLCHYSLTNQKTGLPLPRSIPHPTHGLENCLLCHGTSGLKPFPQDHPWANNDACTFCHSAPEGPIAVPVPQPALSRNIPHNNTGLENCLVCHGTGQPVAFSSKHPWSNNATCSTCHKPAPQSLPVPVTPPAAGASRIPHSTRGLENCLLCHGPTSAQPFVANHPWSTNDTCYACHVSAPSLLPLPGAAPPSGIPSIPHSSAGLDNCLLCHGPGKPRSFSSSHPWVTNEICNACHTAAGSTLPIPPSVNTAPIIPHSITGLSDCRQCHGVTVPIGANHQSIPTSFCTLCHMP